MQQVKCKLNETLERRDVDEAIIDRREIAKMEFEMLMQNRRVEDRLDRQWILQIPARDHPEQNNSRATKGPTDR